jgi:hypothetical protein
MLLLLERTSFSKAYFVVIKGELITRLILTPRLLTLVFFIDDPLS